MGDSLSDARAFQERVDGFDERLRESGHADVADLMRDLLAEHARLRAERRTLVNAAVVLTEKLEATEASLAEAQHRANLERLHRIEAEQARDALHGQLVEEHAVLEAIGQVLSGQEPSDFLLSFPIVRRALDLHGAFTSAPPAAPET